MASSHGTLRWSSVINLMLKGVAVLAALANQIILARCMAPEDFGTYVIVIAWVSFLSVIGGLGWPLSAVRFLPQYRDIDNLPALRGFVWDAVCICLVGSAVVLVGFVAVYTWTGHRLESALAGAPLLLLFGLFTLATGVLLAMHRPLRAEILSNIVRPVAIGLLVGGYAWFVELPNSILALLLTGIATTIALVPTVFAAIRSLPGRLSGPRVTAERPIWLASGFAFLLPLAAMSLIERLDVILVGAFVGTAEAGTYQIASRLAQMVGLAMVSVNALLGPMAAQRIGQKDQQGLQRLLITGVLLNSVLAALVAAVLIIAGHQILLLFGANFVAGERAMEILAYGHFVQAGLGSAGGILALAGRNKEIVIAMLAAVCVHPVMCVVLIPQLGMTGAALATALTTSILALALTCIALHTLKVDTSLRAAVLLGAHRFLSRQ
jgi:O-antigen/teichoic acid export membrane protein